MSENRQGVPASSREVKYLGIHLDRWLTWRTRPHAIKTRASARLGSLFPILANKGMIRKLGKLIVNTYLLSIIIYAAPVYGYLAAVYKRKLQSVLDSALRLVAKVPRQFPLSA